MSVLRYSTKTLVALGSLSLFALPAFAQQDQTPIDRSDSVDQVVEDRTYREQQDADPVEDVQESAKVLQEMKADEELSQVLDEAEGVFIIPDYVTAALIVGGSGGQGILLTRDDNDEWANPAFYNIGEIDVGAQAGASAGSIAMILSSEEAIRNFKEDSNFALNADAGYSIVNWSERAQAEVGYDSDVIVWTDTDGLLGELSIGVTGILFDDEENQEYYGQEASAQEILEGEIDDPQEDMLQQALMEQ